MPFGRQHVLENRGAMMDIPGDVRAGRGSTREHYPQELLRMLQYIAPAGWRIRRSSC